MQRVRDLELSILNGMSLNLYLQDSGSYVEEQAGWLLEPEVMDDRLLQTVSSRHTRTDARTQTLAA